MLDSHKPACPAPSSRPAWERDFPVRQGEDSYTTRREFTKFLGLTSIAFFLGTCWAATRRWMNQRFAAPAAPIAVARVEELAVGSSKLFRYPEADTGEPGILIRLEDQKFVALSQSCTHLACPVHFQAATKQLVCPCHSGFFSAEDGRVLGGPPKRGLDRYTIEIRDGTIYVKAAEAPA